MWGAFASHLGFWLAVANWCEVLAALDGGVPSCRVSSWRLLNIFHFHFFMMDPQVRRSEVLLTALPLAHTVGGPFPMQQSERAGVSPSIQWGLLSFSLSVQVKSREKKQKDSQGESDKTPKLAGLSWPSFLFSPQSLNTFLGDAELNPQGVSAVCQKPFSSFSSWRFMHKVTMG